MNYSKVTKLACAYLKYKEKDISKKMYKEIEDCIKEIEGLNSFKNLYSEYTNIIPLLNKGPYLKHLEGSTKYILTVSTLGASVDKRITYYAQSDLSKAVIFDAVASAYLEIKADEEESKLIENPTFRFCPGYSGTSTDDLKEIMVLLNASSIGIYLLDNNIMIPQKTMVGIIGNSGKKEIPC